MADPDPTRPRLPPSMEPTPPKQPQLFLVGLVILVVTVLLWYLGPSKSIFGGAKKLKYLEFKTLLERGDIASMEMEENRISGKITNDEKFSAYETVIPVSLLQDSVETNAIITLFKEKRGADAEKGFSSTSPNSFLMFFATYAFWAVLLIMLWWLFLRQMRSPGGPGSVLSFGRSRAKLVGKDQRKVTFDDVAGIDSAKEEVQEIIEFLKDPARFQKLGARIPRGVLLVGAPGTGKTLLAKAIAGEAEVPFYSICGSDFVEMFVGVGAARVRDLFKQAKESAPCIIFLDEIDAVGRRRGSGLGGGHDEREQTLNAILVEMDGFDTDDGVIVMAASVTGDTPVLVKENGIHALKSIAEVVDPYFDEGEEGVEKDASGLEVLGMERRASRSPFTAKGRTHFGSSAFKRVRGVFRHRVNEIYEIEHLGGMIRTTGNHSVFVRTPQGVVAKRVDALRVGEILVDIPYVANRTQKGRRQIRAHEFAPGFERTLPVYEAHPEEQMDYALAMESRGEMSQTEIAVTMGVSQTAVSKWQRGVSVPRAISRAYYLHELPETVPVTPSLMRLFGYYVAEGFARKEIDFCFNRSEVEYIEDVKRLMREIFGIEPLAERHITENAVNIVYSSRPLADFFIRHCGKGAHHKHLPEFLFEAPAAWFVEFFRGYSRGDGHLDRRGRAELTSVSERLIRELHWLSRMHGFKGYVSRFTAPAGRTIKGGKPLPETLAWRLGFGKTQNPLSRAEGKANIKRAKIRRITRKPFDGYVYDFCGCDNEAFFGGVTPVLLHNTNRPDVLDPALLRPGRFDREIVIDMPDLKGREAILKVHAKKVKMAKDLVLSTLARTTPMFSGADLEAVINEAALIAVLKRKDFVESEDLEEARDKVKWGRQNKSRVVEEVDRKITAYHESGHALVSCMLPEMEPLHKVTIIPRGLALGVTIRLPDKDRYHMQRRYVLNTITTLFGGRAAEEVFCADITAGAHDDIKKATELARAMICEWGMSEALGPITYTETQEHMFLGREVAKTRNHSEEVARQIDAEVREIMEAGHRKARAIIEEHKETCDRIARALLRYEVLSGAEVQRIIQGAAVETLKPEEAVVAKQPTP